MATFSLNLNSNTRNTANFSRPVLLQKVNGETYDSTMLTPFPEPTVQPTIELSFSSPQNSQYIPVI